MKVLGVDPGMADTGWAVLEGGPQGARLSASGIIRTAAGLPLPFRLREIHAALAAVLAEHRPECMAIEELFFLKAAQSVRATMQARGVILLAACQAQAPVHEYNPRQVKISLTGSGAAEKPQMQKMVQAALALKEILRPDDVADAAAIGLCHLRASRHKAFKVLDRIGGRG
ncbi:MAG TPA: crossover junction endodeoxyribonuclease RuvC [Elusimicrobiota bacterium]|nr:crossover junction endodeoxyribonuclease RuvC [Elusimicrobiota bacterium]